MASPHPCAPWPPTTASPRGEVLGATAPGRTGTRREGMIMRASMVAATAVALVGMAACGTSRAGSPPAEPGGSSVTARDAYLASIHRHEWFDGSDNDTLLRIGAAVCAGLDHDSPVHDIVGMAAAHHIPPKQVRALMRAAMKICPQHRAAVAAYYAARPSGTGHFDPVHVPGSATGQVPTTVQVRELRAPGSINEGPRPGVQPGQRPSSRSPGWTRTNNPPVNSRMLCQLSYRGSCGLRRTG